MQKYKITNISPQVYVSDNYFSTGYIAIYPSESVIVQLDSKSLGFYRLMRAVDAGKLEVEPTIVKPWREVARDILKKETYYPTLSQEIAKLLEE